MSVEQIQQIRTELIEVMKANRLGYFICHDNLEDKTQLSIFSETYGHERTLPEQAMALVIANHNIVEIAIKSEIIKRELTSNADKIEVEPDTARHIEALVEQLRAALTREGIPGAALAFAGSVRPGFCLNPTGNLFFGSTWQMLVSQQFEAAVDDIRDMVTETLADRIVTARNPAQQ